MQIEENGVESGNAEEQNTDKPQLKSVTKAIPGRVERRLSQTSVNSAISNVQTAESQATVVHEKQDLDEPKALALAWIYNEFYILLT